MKKPNFFIIGAPKCGTTSIATWLADHPQIYMSPRKEPHFFNTDEAYILTPNLKQYESLFAGASKHHVAIGEGSVWYLYSRQAISNILEYSKNARFIVCLRNPVEMVYSLHEQQVVSGNEHITDFEKAWRMQEERVRGQAITRWCREPRHLLYGQVCKLGEQLQSVCQYTDPARVLPLVLDDIRKKPRREYLKILAFLGVDDDGRNEFPIFNRAKERRWMFLRKAVLQAGRLKQKLGIYRGLGFLTAVDHKNIRVKPRTPLPLELRRELQEYFTVDVENLSNLLGRDLTGWVREL